MALRTQFHDALLEMRQIGHGLLEDLFELGVFIGFAGELPLKIGRKFLGLNKIVLQRRVVRRQVATEIFGFTRLLGAAPTTGGMFPAGGFG